MSEDNKKCFFTYDELKRKFYEKISTILETKNPDANIPYELGLHYREDKIPFIHVEFHSKFESFKKVILETLPDIPPEQLQITTSDNYESSKDY